MDYVEAQLDTWFANLVSFFIFFYFYILVNTQQSAQVRYNNNSHEFR